MTDFVLTFQHRAPLPLAQPIQLVYENFDGSVVEGTIAMTEIAVGVDGVLYFSAGTNGHADYRVFRADRCVEITFLANGTRVSGPSACADALATLAKDALATNLNASQENLAAQIGAILGPVLITALIYFLFIRQ